MNKRNPSHQGPASWLQGNDVSRRAKQIFIFVFKLKRRRNKKKKENRFDWLLGAVWKPRPFHVPALAPSISLLPSKSITTNSAATFHSLFISVLFLLLLLL